MTPTGPRFRFSLGTLFVVVTVAALGAFAIRTRGEIMDVIRSLWVNGWI